MILEALADGWQLKALHNSKNEHNDPTVKSPGAWVSYAEQLQRLAWTCPEGLVAQCYNLTCENRIYVTMLARPWSSSSNIASIEIRKCPSRCREYGKR